MQLKTLVVGLVAGLASPVAAAPTKGVSAAIYNRIVHFLTIAQATYSGNCMIQGLPRMSTIYNQKTDTNGWVIRDDATKEIIVSFRGTSSNTNGNNNGNYTLATMADIPSCAGCQTHGGYYIAWNTVKDNVLSYVKSATAAYPTYGIVVTGHRYAPHLANDRSPLPPP